MNKKKFDIPDIFVKIFIFSVMFICVFSFIFLTQKQYDNFNFNESTAFNSSTNILYSRQTRLNTLYNNELLLDTSINNKTWNTPVIGYYIWSDGDNIYYSIGDTHMILNNGIWSNIIFNGLTNFWGYNVWTDGNNIYYSDGSNSQFIFIKSTRTWQSVIWNGYNNITGYNLWTDGNNIYFSDGNNTYYLNKILSSWELYNWGAPTDIDGNHIWYYDGNVFYSFGSRQYILNRSTNAWDNYTWNVTLYGDLIWSDGIFIYHSFGSTHYIYYNGTWVTLVWNNSFNGSNVWTDGNYIYASSSDYSYIFSLVPKYSLTMNFENVYVKNIASIILVPLLNGDSIQYVYHSFKSYIYRTEALIVEIRPYLNYSLPTTIEITGFSSYDYNASLTNYSFYAPTGDASASIIATYHIEDYSFISLIDAVISVPVDIFYNATNFEIFGINFYNLLTSTLVLFLIVFIIMKVFKG